MEFLVSADTAFWIVSAPYFPLLGSAPRNLVDLDLRLRHVSSVLFYA